MSAIPKTAKAAVMMDIGKPLEIREVQVPELEPGAILVKNEIAAICGSDLHLWRGTTPFPMKYPFLLGHETLGSVAALGEGRTCDFLGLPLQEGDRILWENTPCGECFFCSVDRKPNLCQTRYWQGVNCTDDFPYLAGGLAEYSYIFPKTRVVKVPDELSKEEAVSVACAGMTTYHGWGLLNGIMPQEIVVVLGAGPLGLYTSLWSKENGAAKTIVVGAPANRLEFAKRWGADLTINIDEKQREARIEEIRAFTQGRGADLVVEVAGVPEAFLDAVEMARDGGRVLVIGNTGVETIPFMPSSLVYKELTVLGSKHAQIESFYQVLEFIKETRGKYPFGELISSKYSLENATDALLAMETGKDLKAAVIP